MAARALGGDAGLRPKCVAEGGVEASLARAAVHDP